MHEIPTPESLKQFMQDNNLTGIDVAMLTGVSPRAVRAWVTPSGVKTTRNIPWAAWAMLQMLIGKATKDELLGKIDLWKKEQVGQGLFERGAVGRPAKSTPKG